MSDRLPRVLTDVKHDHIADIKVRRPQAVVRKGLSSRVKPIERLVRANPQEARAVLEQGVDVIPHTARRQDGGVLRLWRRVRGDSPVQSVHTTRSAQLSGSTDAPVAAECGRFSGNCASAGKSCSPGSIVVHVPRPRAGDHERNSSSREEWRGVLPKWEPHRVPAYVSTIVELECGVRRGGGQPLSLLPRDQGIHAAVNNQYGPRKMSDH